MVVFLQLGFITAGALGDMGLFITIHYMEQPGISIPTQCGVSYGCCKYFLAYLTPGLSEMSGFFFLRLDPNTTQSHCPCSLEGNIGSAALSSFSGEDMRGLYDLN